MRYRVSLKLWEMNEMEDMEYEESEQFAGFEEDPTDAYKGYVPEGFTIAFVDGIRRIDHSAYVWDQSKNSSYEAVFATLSAGAIILKPKSINLIEQSFRMQRVRRVFLVKGDVEESAFSGFDYEVKKLLEDKELSLELLRLLRSEEVNTAREVWKRVKPQLLVCDGTLTSEHRGITCVGFVKTIKRLFISREYAHLLQNLKKGYRTPLIRVHSQRKIEEQAKLDKYTWYVKLAEGEGIGTLARLEAFGNLPKEKVKELADLTAGVLPMFASVPFQDPRSPQNLLPIKVLENTLRKHLGAPDIARKRLQEIFLNA
jgi:uncharacterized protein